MYVGCSTGQAEPLETLFEQRGIGASPPLPWQQNLLSIDTLKCVEKCGAVVLLHDILANLNDVVGPDAEDVGVERSVVGCAHRDAIRNHRFASIPVFLDMRSVEKLWVRALSRLRQSLGENV